MGRTLFPFSITPLSGKREKEKNASLETTPDQLTKKGRRKGRERSENAQFVKTIILHAIAQQRKSWSCSSMSGLKGEGGGEGREETWKPPSYHTEGRGRKGGETSC